MKETIKILTRYDLHAVTLLVQDEDGEQKTVNTVTRDEGEWAKGFRDGWKYNAYIPRATELEGYVLRTDGGHVIAVIAEYQGKEYDIAPAYVLKSGVKVFNRILEENDLQREIKNLKKKAHDSAASLQEFEIW